MKCKRTLFSASLFFFVLFICASCFKKEDDIIDTTWRWEEDYNNGTSAACEITFTSKNAFTEKCYWYETGYNSVHDFSGSYTYSPPKITLDYDQEDDYESETEVGSIDGIHMYINGVTYTKQ